MKTCFEEQRLALRARANEMQSDSGIAAIAVVVVAFAVIMVMLRHSTLPNAFAGKRSALLVIAHPDDEAMFFVPVLRALRRLAQQQQQSKPQPMQLSILCLSSGNAAGLGEVRKQELVKSAEVLGIPRSCVFTVDDEARLADSMTRPWDAATVSRYVSEHVRRTKADLIVTFDAGGVSGHLNHRGVHAGVCHFLSTRAEGTVEVVAADAAAATPNRRRSGSTSRSASRSRSAGARSNSRGRASSSAASAVQTAVSGSAAEDAWGGKWVGPSSGGAAAGGDSSNEIDAYELVTVPTLRAYTGMLDILTTFVLLLLSSLFSSSSASSSSASSSSWSLLPREVMVTSGAPAVSHAMMQAHHSQYVWFRRLHMVFSRYTWVNTLRKMQ